MAFKVEAYQKRLFMSLLIVALMLIVGFIGLLVSGIIANSVVINVIIYTLFVLLLSFLVIVSLGILVLLESVAFKKVPKSLQKLGWLSIKVLYPVVFFLAKIFKLNKEKIKGSFIAINNEMMAEVNDGLKGEELLVLLPHCIQKASCEVKVTHDVDKCKRCGKCDLASILKLKDEYKFNLYVATGGTAAREVVKKSRPKGILAVACERDLFSGIMDCKPLPVVGILNQRPNGPCYNTLVDEKELKLKVKKMLREE
ncbi:DUF116 domain-containing protein [Proteinivorax hydrogeniformans]|uniref:DUF116 domain-containing protein n=1 Tax=Proteinivorax hydrogeniformans TaxID=1826727 RepID=A0AAU8HPH2_9FIRM